MSNNNELTMTELSDFSYLETFEKYKANKLKAARRSRVKKEQEANDEPDEFPSLPDHLKKTYNDANTYEGLNSESTTMYTPMTPMTPMSPQFSFKKQDTKYKKLQADEPSISSAGGDVSSEMASVYDQNQNSEDKKLKFTNRSTTCRSRRDTLVRAQVAFPNLSIVCWTDISTLELLELGQLILKQMKMKLFWNSLIYWFNVASHYQAYIYIWSDGFENVYYL